jgi:hypothetical protein
MGRIAKRTAYFSSASSAFKALGAFFCNFVILAARRPESRMAPVRQISWVRGFRALAISLREFNLFKLLRRHFPATGDSFAVGLSRRDPATETPWRQRSATAVSFETTKINAADSGKNRALARRPAKHSGRATIGPGRVGLATGDKLRKIVPGLSGKTLSTQLASL